YQTEWHELYSNGYGIRNGELKADVVPEEDRKIIESNRDKWIVKYFDEIFNQDLITTSENLVLTELQKWSNRIHTLGNFMIGPVGFNIDKAKGIKRNEDRLDLFLEKLINQPEYAGWYQQFTSFMDSNFLENYFEEDKVEELKDAQLVNLRKG